MADDTPTVCLPSNEMMGEFYEHRERVREQLATHEREWQRFREDIRDQNTAHRDRVDQTITARLRIYGWGGAVAVVGGLVALGVGYFRLEGEFHDRLGARLDEEFSTRNIRRTIQTAARAAAEVVATDQLRPQVEEAKTLVHEVKAGTEKALEPLQRLQRVIELQGQASSFSRTAFDELHDLATASEDKAVRGLAGGMIRMIESAYAFQNWAGDPTIEERGGQPVKLSEVDTERLLTFLNGDDEALRGRAATLLAARNEKRAVPRLVELLRPGGETHLVSLKQEVTALRTLVPELPDVRSRFDWRSVIEWWDANRPSYEGAQ